MTTETNKPVALVTGGSKGIGRAICIEMARSGYDVIVNYLSDAEGARQTLSMVEQLGGNGMVAGFDVSDYEATQTALQQIFATGCAGQQCRPHRRRTVRHDDPR